MGDGVKILAIIPALNEETTVGDVVRSIRSLPVALDPLVVDDGSSDATAESAREAGATVVSLPFNLGIGGAVQTGYQYAILEGYDVAVQVDADGQHIPAEIPKLLRALEAEEADLVVGSRFLPTSPLYRSEFARRIGIRYFAALLTFLLGQTVTDPTSGFRAAGPKAVRLFSRTYPTDYPEVDSLVLARRCGLRLAEVPVQMNRRASGRSSIGAGRSVYYMVKVTLSVMIQCLRRDEEFR